MKNCRLLIENQPNLPKHQFPKRPFINNKVLYYRCSKPIISGDTISHLLSFLKVARRKYGLFPMEIYLDFGEVTIADKLSCIVLECVCYVLITHWRYRVKINIRIINPSITTIGVLASPLNYLDEATSARKEKFCNTFAYNVKSGDFRNGIYRSGSYRRLVDSTAGETDELSKIGDDVGYFLRNVLIPEDIQSNISGVIVELIGNAGEHGDTDCLIDIDVTDDHEKYEEGKAIDGIYRGINVAVINFSNELFEDGLKAKMNAIEYLLTDRYRLVKEAYAKHKPHFDDQYTESDFYRIAAFQHRISGRKGIYKSGGAGLTKLIQSLEERADASNCYMLSGHRVLRFFPEFLEFDSDNWIGFNVENSFHEHPPNKSLFDFSSTHISGTAYNLNFVIKVEEDIA